MNGLFCLCYQKKIVKTDFIIFLFVDKISSELDDNGFDTFSINVYAGNTRSRQRCLVFWLGMTKFSLFGVVRNHYPLDIYHRFNKKAYGVAWGATIFLFGGSMVLICDRNKEEIYYREKIYLNEDDEEKIGDMKI